MTRTHRILGSALLVGAIIAALLVVRANPEPRQADSTAAAVVVPPSPSGLERAPISRSAAKRSVTVAPPALPVDEAPSGSDAEPVSAACFAARTREEQRTRPTEVEVEAMSQQRDQEHARITQAVESCQAVEGPAFDACLVANGVDRGTALAEEESGHKALQAALRVEAFRIASRADARSLLAAAFVLPTPEAASDEAAVPARAPEASAWLLQAQERGRDDALVQWSVARLGVSSGGGDPPALLAARAAARARLPMLEPDNAAAYLFALEGDDASRGAPTRADLARAAAMSRYRVPMAEQVTLVLDALRDMPAYPGLREQALRMNPEHEAAAACAGAAELLKEIHMMLAISSAVATSGIPDGLHTACSLEATASAASARDDCLRVLGNMYAQGSLMEQALAAAIARRIAPAGSVRDWWDERHRHYLWRQLQMMHATAAVDPYELSRIHEHAWRSGSEDLAIDELLTRAGTTLEPPADWRPPIGP